MKAYYESDGDKGAETHYIVVYEDEAMYGCVRIDFYNKQTAKKVLPPLKDMIMHYKWKNYDHAKDVTIRLVLRILGVSYIE